MGGKVGVAAKFAASLMMLAAWFAFAVAGERAPAPTSAPSGGSVEVARRPAVSVTGHAGGLYPGKVAKLHVVVRNTSPSQIVVRRVSARVGDAAPGCSGSVLRVKPLRAHMRIRPGKRVRTKLVVTMLPIAPDACQGVTFPITFRARARLG
jgi:hypothetical protein